MKKSNQKGWEELIKSRFQDFEESPEDQLWSNINQKIQPEPKWSLLPAATILLLLIGAWMAFLYLQEPLKERKSSSLSSNNSKATFIEDDAESQKSHKAFSLPKKENEQNKPYSRKQALIASPKAPTTPVLSTLKPSLAPSSPSATEGTSLEGKSTSKQEQLLSILPKKGSWLDESTDGDLKKKVILIPQLIKTKEVTVAENSAPQEKKKAGLEIWGSFNPMLTYRKVKPNLEDDIRMLSLEENQAFSLNRFGIQTSVGVSYFLTPKFAIKAGAFYRLTQNKWSYSYFSGSPDSLLVNQLNENSISTQPVFTRNTEKVNEVKQYLGALVGLQFVAQGPLRKTMNLELQASREPTHAHILYFLAFDIDLEKHLFKKFYLNAGPSLLWELNSFKPNEVQRYEIKPYSLGLKLGVSYKLNR